MESKLWLGDIEELKKTLNPHHHQQSVYKVDLVHGLLLPNYEPTVCRLIFLLSFWFAHFSLILLFLVSRNTMNSSALAHHWFIGGFVHSQHRKEWFNMVHEIEFFNWLIIAKPGMNSNELNFVCKLLNEQWTAHPVSHCLMWPWHSRKEW